MNRTSEFQNLVAKATTAPANNTATNANTQLDKVPGNDVSDSQDKQVHLRDPLLRDAVDILATMKQVSAFNKTMARALLASTDECSAAQREELDARGAMLIAGLKERIQLLENLVEEAASISEQQNSKSPSAIATKLSSVLPWFGSSKEQQNAQNGGISAAHVEHYRSIIWSLNTQLMRLSYAQQDIQERRMQLDSTHIFDQYEARSPKTYREAHEGINIDSSAVARRNSLLRKRKSGASTQSDTNQRDNDLTDKQAYESSRQFESASSSGIPEHEIETSRQSQMLMSNLEAENTLLIQEWESNLSEVRQAESALLEIARMQTQIARHLAQHNATLESLWEDVEQQSTEVRAGNRELSTTIERGKGRRVWFLVFVLFLCALLLLFDWVHSRRSRRY